MPWEVAKNPHPTGKPKHKRFLVKKKTTGEVVGSAPTRAEAIAMIVAMRAHEKD